MSFSRDSYGFFTREGPFSLGELARVSGCALRDESHSSLTIEDIAPLETAGKAQISFLDNHKYASVLHKSKAGACVLAPSVLKNASSAMALLVSDEPYASYAKIARHFYPSYETTAGDENFLEGRAIIDETAHIGKDCRLGEGVMIGAGARIGDGCALAPYVVVGNHVVMGANCAIGSHGHIECAVLGARVRMQSGARIGLAGFGFAVNKKEMRFEDVPQVGRVVIGNDCFIGANTTIARGSLRDTVIGDGCRIDNLVQIAHNVVLGRGCILAAQVGISGSTEAGDFVMFGGQAGIAGHLKIGAGAQIAADAGLMRDVPPGGKVGGSPAMPVLQWHRQTAYLKKKTQR